MGIGNRLRVLVPGRRRVLLITPHGDREPTQASLYQLVWDRISLPLMGIGNRREPRLHLAHAVLLITPHGDREPCRPCTTCGCTGTHYPSWGSGTRDQRCGALRVDRVAHYPSWGSGTNRRVGARRLENDSLPLMGIGNEVKTARFHSDEWGSLPLMGIGNVRDGVRLGLRVDVLITPHGDREPIFVEAHQPVETWLITPHGDREPNTGLSGRRRPRPSLPLMGIGNPRTPAPLLPPRRQAHYPSWGSGTFRPLECGRPTTGYLITPHGDREPGRIEKAGQPLPVSLPLMGIGNFRPVIWTTSPFGVSLPLMGIGNSTRALLASASRRLITPHGDREPPGPLVVVVLQPDLITPHGDREQFLPPTDSDKRYVSLPLMGIGNANLALPPLRPERRLITPHGDREPLELPDGVVILRGELITPHGDRERTATPGTVLRRTYSLPLMGIGNEPTPIKGAQGLWLITPHGDRERHPGGWDQVRSRISLPLMGIGNAGLTTRNPSGHPGLITPHGDREPITSRARTAGSTSHYPSWGSGTGKAEAAALTLQNNSLPLMGIGNMVVPPGVVSRYCSSLPLMGIGNPYSVSFTPSTPRKRLKIPL